MSKLSIESKNIIFSDQMEQSYYEKNKEKILKKSRQRFICECGAEVSYSNKKCHKSSSKHIIYVKSKESQNALQNSTLHITES